MRSRRRMFSLSSSSDSPPFAVCRDSRMSRSSFSICAAASADPDLARFSILLRSCCRSRGEIVFAFGDCAALSLFGACCCRSACK